jgi:hypothetical protein
MTKRTGTQSAAASSRPAQNPFRHEAPRVTTRVTLCNTAGVLYRFSVAYAQDVGGEMDDHAVQPVTTEMPRPATGPA